ncbi:MAG: aminoglycoside phosphotransferase family protein [Burkholderiaceae bacterium]
MPTPDHSALLLDAPRIGEQLVQWIPAWRGCDPARLVLHQSRRRISRKTEEAGAPYLGVAYAWADESMRAPWLYLRAHSRGTSAAAAREHGALHLPSIDAVAWLLPHDPALKALPQMLDGDATARGVVGEPFAPGRGAEWHAGIVRYEPESHCTVRFTARGAPELPAIYGKCHADARWKVNARHLRALWSYGESHSDAFAVARPLAASAELQALWQQGVAGTPLREALADDDAERRLAQLVRGLQGLQAMAPLATDRLDPAVLLARTRKQASKLVRAEPALAPSLVRVMTALERLPLATTSVNVHGDFHIDQLLVSGSRLVLFDFDNLALGHPAHDVADCASQLLTDSGLAESRRRWLARHLIDVARDAFDRCCVEADLQWHLRALLLRKAYSFFVRHRAGWITQAREAIALAEQGLQAVAGSDDCLAHRHEVAL